jgi:hypothetical protein
MAAVLMTILTLEQSLHTMFESQWDIFVQKILIFYTFLLDAHATSTGNLTSLFVCASNISFHFCFWGLVKTLEYYLYSWRHMLWCCRYAIGNAERPTDSSKVGWLDLLANDTHQFYGDNNTGGPSIKVHPSPHESIALKLNWTIYFEEHPLLGHYTVQFGTVLW